jgi:hypothetical protein
MSRTDSFANHAPAKCSNRRHRAGPFTKGRTVEHDGVHHGSSPSISRRRASGLHGTGPEKSSPSWRGGLGAGGHGEDDSRSDALGVLSRGSGDPVSIDAAPAFSQMGETRRKDQVPDVERTWPFATARTVQLQHPTRSATVSTVRTRSDGVSSTFSGHARGRGPMNPSRGDVIPPVEADTVTKSEHGLT